MTTTTTIDPGMRRDELRNILDDALMRTPRQHRAELVEFVQRRAARLDRQLTAQRLHSIIGAGWHRLGVVQKAR